jgi:inorganic pyrophosphatase
MKLEFTDPRLFLGKTVTVEIDRPIGSKHKNVYYLVNYGFVPDTISPDGDKLDAYVLGVFNPVKEFTGKCIAIIHRIDDNDDKLVVIPEDMEFSDEQIEALTEFQERFFKSIIKRER